MKILRSVLLRGMFFGSVILFGLFAAESTQAQEPAWYPFTIARPEHRSMIQAMPIYQRPYRPLHFYGNSVRREYYRGVSMPMPRDWVQSTRRLLTPLRR